MRLVRIYYILGFPYYVEFSVHSNNEAYVLSENDETFRYPEKTGEGRDRN